MTLSRKSPLAYLLTVNLFAISATATAGLSGKIFNPDGSTIPDAPIRLRDETVGIDVRTRSDDDGSYDFPDVPPATYLLTVNMPCCLYAPFVNNTVAVESDRSEFDIYLALYNISVEGDDVLRTNAELLSQREIPNLPVPRMSDGRPDLSGVWLPIDDPYPEDPKPLEWAGKLAQERAANFLIDLPSAHCLPGSPPVPGGATFTARFVQRPELLVILFEDVPGFRQVYLDGRSHPEKPNPTWMGHSVGTWDGDTLVIETIGFNDRGWTDIYPRTTMLRMEERYTRTSYGQLEVTVTYEDPGVFVESWSRHMGWELLPDVDLLEYVCENNQWIGTGAEDVGLGP
jgi:hypothetical protein